MNSGLVPSSALCLGISRFESWFGDYYDRQYIFFSMAQQTKVGQGLLIVEASRPHSVRHNR
jgi:hypothetical protein